MKKLATPESLDRFRSLSYKLGKKWFSYFMTSQLRPMVIEQYHWRSDEVKKMPKFGIVIQGPIFSENNFTLETFKFYKKMFPDSPIIFSTWKDQDPELITKIQNLGIVVILNNYPAYEGFHHINYQIVTTQNGLKRAQELGCEYVIKTRPDQRFYAPNILSYLYELLEHFPVQGKAHQKKRIIGTSLFSFKYRLYSVSDIFLCGHISDMITYFNPALDKRTNFPPAKTLRQHSQDRVGEMYLSTAFLEKIGWKLRWTLTDSWRAYAERFIIIDSQSIDLFWIKAEPFRELRFHDYTAIKNTQNLNFREWFLLYTNLKNKKNIPEQTLSDPWGSTL